MKTKFLLLFFVFSFLFKTDFSFDQDLGRHIKLGEIIWQTHQVPQTNLFSYTNPNFPFINTHWLFEVFAYLFSQSLGLPAFLLFKIAILIISVWLILKIIPNGNKVLLLPIGFIFLHVLRERADLRPEIFSFFFTASTYFILEKYLKKPTKLIYLLPFIQLIWINTHIYFFIGLVLQAIFLIHLVYQHLRFHTESVKLKILVIIFVLSVLASLINPSGLAGFLYPLNVTKNYGYTIVENQTMFLLENINFRDPNFLFVKLTLAVILLSIIIVILNIVKNLKIKPRDPSLITQDDKGGVIKNILLSTFGAALALLNVRSFPYLILISLPAVMQNFGPVKHKAGFKILAIFFGLILLVENYFYLNGDYYRYNNSGYKPNPELLESGKKALDFVINNNLPNPIYNNFDIGSYIIYRGYPKYKVFVDGRPEAYPQDFFQQIYIPSQSDPQKFKELDEKLNFKTIIFSHTDQTPWGKAFLTSIVKNDNWQTVYLDDFMIILVKNEAITEKKLKPIDLSKLNPTNYSLYSYLSYLKISLFLIQTGNNQPAQKFAEKGLSLFPESPLGNTLFGINSSNKLFW